MTSKWWRVEVSDEKGQIVAIEPEMLAGREIDDASEKVIRDAIGNLMGFIGYREHGPGCPCNDCEALWPTSDLHRL